MLSNVAADCELSLLGNVVFCDNSQVKERPVIKSMFRMTNTRIQRLEEYFPMLRCVLPKKRQLRLLQCTCLESFAAVTK